MAYDLRNELFRSRADKRSASASVRGVKRTSLLIHP